MMTRSEAAEKIFQMLITQGFDEWYKKEFQDFVEGVEGAGSREDMISAIEEMLGGAR